MQRTTAASNDRRRSPRAARVCSCVAGVLLLVSACSNPVGLSSSTLVPEQSAMAYFQWVQSASSDAMQAELRGLTRSNQNQQLRDVKRGLLLSLRPNAAATDEAEAIRLLTAVTTAESHRNLPDDYLVFATHWLQVLQERHDLRDYIARRSEAQTSLDSLQERFDELEQRFEVLTETRNSLEKQNALLEQQNKLMQQQIDALTIIEQQLVDQDQKKADATP